MFIFFFFISFFIFQWKSGSPKAHISVNYNSGKNLNSLLKSDSQIKRNMLKIYAHILDGALDDSLQ